MSDKKFAKMDRVKLLELLCQLTEENETLSRRLKGMEEANAEMTLRTRELEQKAMDAQAKAEVCSGEMQTMRSSMEADEAQRQALPAGNFAEAMMQQYEIAQRTQEAADAYIALCRSRADEAQNQAQQTLDNAREQADAMLRQAEAYLTEKTAEAESVVQEAQKQAEEKILQAEEHCRVLEQKEGEIRQKLRQELDGLNQMVARLDGEQV